MRNWKRFLITLVPLGIAMLHAAGTIRLDPLDKLDAMIYDARLRVFMPRTLDENIVIIDLDEKSLAEVGHWPWSRHHLARLVDILFAQQQIAVLGFDVVFAEADESSGLKQLQALAQGRLRQDARFAQQVAELTLALDYDQQFARALQNRPVVLGYYFTSDRGGRTSGQLPSPVFDEAALQKRRFQITDWDGYGSNIPALAQAATAGYFNPVVDSDGVVRSLPLLARHHNGYYESLALAMFRLLTDQPHIAPGYPTDTVADGSYPHLESVLLQQNGTEISIPVDDRVAVLIPFRGPGGPKGNSFTYISATDVLHERLPPGLLEGKIVLVGTTAPGLLDMRATPVSEVYPGVETHANLLSALLEQRLPVRPDYARGYDLLVLLAAGLLLAMLLPRLAAQQALALSVTAVTAVIGLNLWLFTQAQLVMPLAGTLLALMLASALDMAYGYFVESRAKRELANLFGAYVPPELVDEMVKDPDRYSMQARDKELTVMFSDMRGFTSLSETMAPTQLQQLLNRVFSLLTAAIRAQGGTIDKYMGDCVMAFWGAPVDTPAHARQAVVTALAMRQVMHDINAEHQQKGLPPIGMGIGINTGTMCVGDMGSDLRRSYTVIGDAVNLGSRLEGVSKLYGVDIVVSGSTHQQAGESFIWQALDLVKVKGKNEAVPIFTVWGYANTLTPAIREELDQWDTFLHLWRDQQWGRALEGIQTLVDQHPRKTLYTLYLERVRNRQNQIPDPDWDGSTQFETK